MRCRRRARRFTTWLEDGPGEGIGLEYVPLQSVGNIIGALRSGQVDGWSIVPHIALALAGSGAVHIVGMSPITSPIIR